MTPEQTALLSIAAIEHYGETVTLPNCAKLKRYIHTGAARRERFEQSMNSPTWQWQKPAKRR